ncbi:hypothetical protein FH972_024488 [Carpinus fangiana]|uniref:Uncharacterized protein n=1 Tax=Carpinus fangiana TaxID=176857 RepID=A0A5N6L0P6_9ROSI|nr:hypothetical protein FH972_024488 [Carpinus fangiana]
MPEALPQSHQTSGAKSPTIPSCCEELVRSCDYANITDQALTVRISRARSQDTRRLRYALH